MNNKQVPSLRVLVALCGDMVRDPESIVKYGTFIETLGNRFPVTAVYNAKLQGLQRLENLIQVWHPDQKKWRARARKNPHGFIIRSRQAAQWVRTFKSRADFLLQLGVLFDAGWENNPIPRIIYTDYTAAMSARRPEAGRSPFYGKTLDYWLGLERQALLNAAHICVRSKSVKESLINDYALKSGQITIIGGGVNLCQLPEVTDRPADRAPTALFIGTDFYRKGGDLALHAFAKARTVVPSAKLIFVTQDSIPSTFPKEGVKFLRPIWDRERYLELYSQADVLIMPSRLETWGDVLLEAMAFSLPCIGVTGQPMEEIIRDGETGLLIPPEQTDALAESLISLFKQPQLSQQMGKAGRDLVAREFTWNHVIERITPVIEAHVHK